MERALVIGCPGAGKSTFARALRDASGLPLCYLDLLWHKRDGSTADCAEFDAQLDAVLRRERWIIDGNYLRTLGRRLARCDTVFLLDYPLPLCLAGARARIGQVREDLPWVENFFDPEFRQWIETFPEKQLPQIYRMLESCQKDKHIFIFRSRQDAEAYLQQWDSSRKGGTP